MLNQEQFVLRSHRRVQLFGAASAAIVAIAISGVATSARAQGAAPLPTTASPNSEEEVGQIVVTGSRIARRDYVSTSPIVTVSPDVIKNSSNLTIEATLSQVPQFAPVGGTLQTGRATLNLRNMGNNRNLVLLDGRRLQPAQANFAVDTNTVPQSIIEGVEVISGGASAVYGSDALSGVVNFKLRRRFSGVEATAQVGQSDRGDYGTYSASVLAGGNFADDKGNAFFAIDFSRREAVRFRDRDFYSNAFALGLGSSFPFIGYGYTKPSGNAPAQAEVDAYFRRVSPTYVPGSVSRNSSIAFNNDGVSLFNPAGASIYNFAGSPDRYYGVQTTATGSQAVVYNSTYNNYVSSPLSRWSTFGRGEYKVSENITAYAQGMYTNYTTRTNQPSTLLDNYWALNIPRDAAHPVPEALDYLLNSRGAQTGTYVGSDGQTHILGNAAGTPWLYGGQASFQGPIRNLSTNHVYQVLVGVKGSLPSVGWDWEVTGQHGKTEIFDTIEGGATRFTRIQELVAAPFYGRGYKSPITGSVVCSSGIVPFGESNTAAVARNPNNSITLGGQTFSRTISNDCLNYISGRTKNSTALVQDVVEGTLQGALFSLPAGQVRLAAGGSFRYNSYAFTPDTLYEVKADTSSDIINNFGLSPTGGSTKVYEGYAELLVPLLKDKRFFQSLELDLATRYSDYQQAGGVWAYKADGNWAVDQTFSLRGGYQRAVRAPNVNELFGPQTTVFSQGPNATDPCVTNAALPYGNNPGLNPNTAQVRALCRALIPGSVPYDPTNYAGAGAGFLLLVGSQAGNPNVKPEKADTFTVGGVFRPRWELPLDAKISLSVDYYNIRVKGAIAALSAVESYQLCFNQNGSSNANYSASNAFCQSIVRDPTNGFPVNVANLNQNLGGLRTSGIDTQLDLSLRAGPGNLAINSVVTYLDSFKKQLAPNSPFIEYGGTTNGAADTYHKLRATTSASYSVGPGMIGLRWRFYGKIKDATSITNKATTIQGIDAYSNFDLYGSYDLSKSILIRAGIDNVFDADPRSYGLRQGATQSGFTIPGYYDVIGRRYYVSARLRY